VPSSSTGSILIHGSRATAAAHPAAAAMVFFEDRSYSLLGALDEKISEREVTGNSTVTSGTTDEEASLSVSATPDGFKKAVVSGDAAQVRLMIRSKADIDFAYQNGLTPLHFAAIHNHTEVARILKYAGANILAETTDENHLTAASIAHASGHNEVFEIICEELPDAEEKETPVLRRSIGPFVIAAVAGVDTVLFLFLLEPDTRWDGWEDAPGTMGNIACFRVVVFTFEAVCLLLLIFTRFLDPGAVEPDEVAFVRRLRELPEDQLLLIGDDSFSVLKDGVADPVHTFRWCRTCGLWRPPSVSHCSECRHCFWRFDHHCAAIGNCVAMRNHRFFALGLLTGATAWVIADIAVLHRLIAHGALSSLDLWWPPRAGNEMLYLSAFYLLFGLLVLSVFLPFTVFHIGSLIGNYTTKSMWKPSTTGPSARKFNSPGELKDIFCMPLRLRGRRSRAHTAPCSAVIDADDLSVTS